MKTEKFRNLVQFLGGCFNQDWRLDDPTPEAVVMRFVAENSEEFVTDVVSELDELLSLSLTEEELQRVLFEEFHCYYLPTETSIGDWLSHVRASLSVGI
ncbi:MAG TPA: contact-dependent growth inhibition system immunity protein [Candidatus Paceibacterota bacterium]|nr:contact-dependent growth inhibition system immunity protein [Candidatus Paceibacterota bacterium]